MITGGLIGVLRIVRAVASWNLKTTFFVFVRTWRCSSIQITNCFCNIKEAFPSVLHSSTWWAKPSFSLSSSSLSSKPLLATTEIRIGRAPGYDDCEVSEGGNGGVTNGGQVDIKGGDDRDIRSSVNIGSSKK
ncbi:hypothetical protein L596_008859 [Steinernema carpocapsae]|uniref:Uncharacterized protein n=1 Tax=Steinernema carpocapsae TaxID=34508 RepID=A0A4U5PEV2_STECR|nr:hypothetical protein L596_008859 [Steinernema carpocapsae]